MSVGPQIIDYRISEKLQKYADDRGWNTVKLGYVMGVSRWAAWMYLNQKMAPSRKRLMELREDGPDMRALCDELLEIMKPRKTIYMRSLYTGERIKIVY